MVRLTGLGSRKSAQLSGGQRQRVAPGHRQRTPGAAARRAAWRA
jgi:ABC-type sugar transport system ATPase subunit